MTEEHYPRVVDAGFEQLKKVNQYQKEYWSARDLQPLLGYNHWRSFEKAIQKAVTSCEQSGNDPSHHFARARKPIAGGKGAVQEVPDYHLSRFACRGLLFRICKAITLQTCTILASFVFWFGSGELIRAEDATKTEEQALAKDDPRHSLKITLELDKKEYFLGENVLLHYTIRNQGKQAFYINDYRKIKSPFHISLGGDSRNGMGRATRFKVEAIDQQGCKAEDPYPVFLCFGGMAGIQTLNPGDEWCESLPLLRYRTPAATGTYTIRVYHDLGWGQPESQYDVNSDIPNGLSKSPILTATVHLVMPTPAQARQVVEAM